MARPKSLPDAEVLAAVRRLMAEDGQMVSFGAAAKATGLAPPTLAQRYGTVAAMRTASVRDGWQVLAAATATAIDAAADKGPQGLLKALDGVAGDAGQLLAGSADDIARALAADWRSMVETALAQRLGPGGKAREAAAILFAAWQGQALWGGEGFRIKDAAKRLASPQRM